MKVIGKMILLSEGKEGRDGTEKKRLQQAPDFQEFENGIVAFGNTWERRGFAIEGCAGEYYHVWYPQKGILVDYPQGFWQGKKWEWQGNTYLAGTFGESILSKQMVEDLLYPEEKKEGMRAKENWKEVRRQ